MIRSRHRLKAVPWAPESAQKRYAVERTHGCNLKRDTSHFETLLYGWPTANVVDGTKLFYSNVMFVNELKRSADKDEGFAVVLAREL